ncbi:MAG: hypothetical protein MUO31_06740 [Thermodesulfovibrionales bacterium]|nr:hypothetical protein [Thermodesulfovibrionales bacterium]
MARITTKFGCGDNVNCKGIPGQVTAIFIRGKGRAYEFSYLNGEGEPTCVNAEECELSKEKQQRIGYKHNE